MTPTANFKGTFLEVEAMNVKKSTPKVTQIKSVSRATKPPKKQAKPTAAQLQKRLALVERERDYYVRELTHRVAKEVGVGDLNEDELYSLLKNGSNVSLESIIRDIANDAEQ